MAVGSAAFIGGGLFAGLFFNKTIAAPSGSIEADYAQRGPYTVEKHRLYDEHKVEYIYYYPVTDATDIPVILIGNGSYANADKYAKLMEHFASHGFFVMDNDNEVTGTGEPIIEILQTLDVIREKEDNSEEASILQQLDMTHIGAVGHSQGSTGVMNAHTNFEAGSRLTTGISVSLPKLQWCDPEDVYDTSKIRVPWLIMTGTLDKNISPESSCLEALETMPEDVEGYFLNAEAQGHLAFEKNGGKYRGVMTAWFAYRLQGDERAGELFYGQAPEIEQNPGWASIRY